MMDLRRTGGCHWLFYRKFGFGHYNHWYSCGVTNIQNWPAVSLAVRGRGKRDGWPDWLCAHPAEPDLDHFRWPMGLLGAPFLWCIAVYHHHWHPVCQATFQDGRLIVSAVRERGSLAFLNCLEDEKGFYWYFPNSLKALKSFYFYFQNYSEA